MKNFIILINVISFSLFISHLSFGQLVSHDKIEKGYIQTDKPMYVPGDDIWIKAWIVNGANMPSLLSNRAKLQLIKPDGSMLLNKETLLKDGKITEYLKLNKTTVGGIYTLKIKTLWMSSLSNSFEYTKEIIVQKYDPPRLLMKIDLDKESYGKGESVTVNFNVKDLKDRPITNVNVSYSLYIDGIESQKLFADTDSKGESSANFILPIDINSSNVSINAKVTYRSQAESISKRVPIILENIDLQFLPEGGSLVEGYKNVMAFKALSETGDPADVAGDILNEEGQKISEFRSAHDGMGKIAFTPNQGEKYFAKICSPYESTQLIPIQYQVKSGTKIFVADHSSKEIIVEIKGKTKIGMQVILSNLCNDIWSTSIGSKSEKSDITIPIDDLPQGIHKISLKSKSETISERLVFLHPDRGIQVTMDLDKNIYELRDKVTAKIKTTDYKGRPLSADLGISVVEDKMLSYADDKQEHLVSELLLSSELQGDIHEPNYYFDSITTETIAHLDLVMLTHGWRTYMEEASEEKVISYFFNQNTYVGQVCKRKDGKGIKTQILLHENNQDYVSVLDTDEDGYFMVPLRINQSFNVYAKTKNKNALIKTIAMKDFTDLKSNLYSEIKEKWLSNPKFLTKEILEIEQQAIPRKKEQFVMSLEEGVLMDAVKIVEYKVPLIEIDNTTSGATITGEAIKRLPTKSINAIAATTAGITVAGEGAISIRGSRANPTVYYVDGVRVSGLIPQTVGFNENYNVFSRSYNNLYRLKNDQVISRQHIRNRFAASNKRQFYVPKYQKSEVRVRSDFRQTIYWNPSVQTDEFGEATISFYTSDEVTSFSVIAEGLTADGKLGRGSKKVVAVKSLNVNCKLPAYFVLGDTAQLSVVVNNDSEFDQNVKLGVRAPNMQIEIENNGQSIFIKKGESFSYQVRAIPTNETIHSELAISAFSDRKSDILFKKFAVLNPYFPQQLSFSGVDSDTFDIEFSNPIMSSLRAEFNTYNPVNTALKGIQSLLRRPSGCFEQVSSSTYPNVMVYQYLNRDKMANKVSLDKAMKFIKRGYKKLVGYETPENGFEWYGRAPANVRLTAYGLLEFTDMAKIFKKVDPKMLNRTIDFLISSKDGKGGFMNQKGNSGFGSFLYEVQTAYVLYALSSQNIKQVDISEEYKIAKAHAAETKDLYLSAMMALTAQNQGLTDDYQELLNIVKNGIDRNPLADITCLTTITRSGKHDKNIETLAFCALALMKGDLKNKHIVGKIIDHLISSRRGGRFGSTQATCFSIKAILAYADWNPQKENIDETTISAFIDNEILASTENRVDITNHITGDTKNFAVEYSGASDKSFEMNIHYMSKIPRSSADPELGLSTRILNPNCSLADQVSLEVELINLQDRVSANPTIIVGIPAGMSLQMKQLKELYKEGIFDYFEMFDNKLVLYFNEMKNLERKKIQLDLKADIAGQYTAPPSCAYPYYDDQNCTWIRGAQVRISQNPLPLNF